MSNPIENEMNKLDTLLRPLLTDKREKDRVRISFIQTIIHS